MPLKVELLAKHRLTINGFTRTHEPGSIVTIGRAEAQRLIELNKARLAKAEAGSGVSSAPPMIAKPVVVSSDNPGVFPIPYGTLLIWDGTIPLPQERMEAGHKLLDRWQVAIPLCRYDILALHIGSQDERERTQAIIRDLRVPVYETGLMFIKRCDETADLLREWHEQKQPYDDPRLAFLRALYVVKPLVLALPHTWVSDD